MLQAFSNNSPYKKRARFAAILWTLLIFVLCLMPGKEIPDVNVPFIDKWTHLILFGGFSFLWLCAYPTRRFAFTVPLFLIAAFLGWLTETLQGMFPSLGRTKDVMDMLADGIGATIGIILFCLLYIRTEKLKANVK